MARKPSTRKASPKSKPAEEQIPSVVEQKDPLAEKVESIQNRAKELAVKDRSQAAKYARIQFSLAGWPNEDQPLNVQDFLKNAGVKI